MGRWVEEKPTMQLRFVCRDEVKVLQQLWKITKGDMGRVYYIEEWRDVPLQAEKEEDDGR
jgi:hypothetical protein